MAGRLVPMILTTIGLSACDIVGIGYERSLALLGDGGIPIDVTVPDTVTQNVPFGVSIAYWGSSSCTRLDEVDVSSAGAVVTITPYVKRPRSGTCTDDLHRFTVKQDVTVSVVGDAAVRVVGLFDRRDTTVIRSTHAR